MINDIRIAANGLYNAKAPEFIQSEKHQNIDFNEIMDTITLDNQENKENKINFTTLGAPAGFFADISMINETDAKDIGIIQFDNYSL